MGKERSREVSLGFGAPFPRGSCWFWKWWLRAWGKRGWGKPLCPRSEGVPTETCARRDYSPALRPPEDLKQKTLANNRSFRHCWRECELVHSLWKILLPYLTDVEDTYSLCACNSTARYTANRNMCPCTPREKYLNIHSNIICNNPILETHKSLHMVERRNEWWYFHATESIWQWRVINE